MLIVHAGPRLGKSRPKGCGKGGSAKGGLEKKRREKKKERQKRRKGRERQKLDQGESFAFRRRHL